jgi:homoserine dehydrogenase
MQTIVDTESDIVVEATVTNIKTGEPSMSYFKTALSMGKHVVTSNKGHPALAYKELKKLVEDNGVQLRIESTVLSGTPGIYFATENLAGHNICGVKGIINGTTNYVLTKIENGVKYEEALKEAKDFGYAEANPAVDVEGWDAVAKIMILGNAVLGGELKVEDVEREGITGVTMEMIRQKKNKGERIKLISEAYILDGEIRAKVGLESIHVSDPLASVSGTMNALTVMTDGLLDVTVIGDGAGGVGTAHGLLSDIISIID